MIVPTTVTIADMMELDPRPFVILVAIFSNLGGTSTMIGDPPNLIIGEKLFFTNLNNFSN